MRPLGAPLNVGLEEMRKAMRWAGLQQGAADTMVPEPPRGPALVSHLPLSTLPVTAIGGSGVETGVHALKAAMALAGLSAGRRWYLAVVSLAPEQHSGAFFAPPLTFRDLAWNWLSIRVR